MDTGLLPVWAYCHSASCSGEHMYAVLLGMSLGMILQGQRIEVIGPFLTICPPARTHVYSFSSGQWGRKDRALACQPGTS